MTPLRSPHTASCSRAAARKVSPAASSTEWPCAWKCFASLPIDVVFPAPLTPAIMITNGRAGPTDQRPLERREEVDQRRLEQRLRIGVAAGALPSRAKIVEQMLRGGMPTSAVMSAVSSSSSVSSSSLRREKTPPSAPASFSRDRASPAASRSRPRAALLVGVVGFA